VSSLSMTRRAALIGGACLATATLTAVEDVQGLGSAPCGEELTDPVEMPYQHLRKGIRLRPMGPLWNGTPA